MAPVTMVGSTSCLLCSLATAPNYFQASGGPRSLKTPVLAGGGERGEGCADPSQPRAYGTERCLGRDMGLGSCKSLLRDL